MVFLTHEPVAARHSEPHMYSKIPKVHCGSCKCPEPRSQFLLRVRAITFFRFDIDSTLSFHSIAETASVNSLSAASQTKQKKKNQIPTVTHQLTSQGQRAQKYRRIFCCRFAIVLLLLLLFLYCYLFSRKIRRDQCHRFCDTRSVAVASSSSSTTHTTHDTRRSLKHTSHQVGLIVISLFFFFFSYNDLICSYVNAQQTIHENYSTKTA